MASTGPARAFQADPYDYGEVRRLAAELELAEPVAVTLVRRGYRTVDAARLFLEARESHEPSEFRGMEEVCEQILSVARGPGRITIHGDYDVDGVTSTSILVSTLRSLGAECDWFIPDRLSDGYGLTMSSVEELRPSREINHGSAKENSPSCFSRPATTDNFSRLSFFIRL